MNLFDEAAHEWQFVDPREPRIHRRAVVPDLANIVCRRPALGRVRLEDLRQRRPSPLDPRARESLARDVRANDDIRVVELTPGSSEPPQSCIGLRERQDRLVVEDESARRRRRRERPIVPRRVPVRPAKRVVAEACWIHAVDITT